MGWEALSRWGDAVRLEPLSGGAGVNQVWSVRVGGRLAIARLGRRSDADLAWETDLLRHLDREGMAVPVPIRTTDGRLFVDGLVVMTYVPGEPPSTEADWRRVAGTLRRLHQLTQDWPQRPGWRSSTDLLQATTGTKVDLGEMPPEGVARCRAAWARLAGRATCVVHGDPNPGNIRMTADRVGLIDWDESHVDVPDLDLALPHNAAGVWVFGAGLESQRASIVAVDGMVTDGPFPETKEVIGGFAVVEVGSRDEALEWAAKLAAACRCAQEVREVLPEPDL